MKVDVQKSFEKDIAGIHDPKLARKLNAIIHELESCRAISTIRNLKRMTTKGNYYRIRIGDYRLGLKTDNDTLILLRFMHRKEIYRYFP